MNFKWDESTLAEIKKEKKSNRPHLQNICCFSCGTKMHHKFTVDKIPLFECKSCCYMKIHPAARRLEYNVLYADNYFIQGKAGYTDYLAERKVLSKRGRYYVRVARRNGIVAGKVLDVGAAAGFILKQFVRAGWKGIGIEPNSMMQRYAVEELNLSVVNGTFEQFNQPRETFDLILYLQVLEHLYDPKNVIQCAYHMLKPGGFILVETWDYQSVIARILGQAWHQINPPWVVHWFSFVSLDILFENCGFKRVDNGRPIRKILWKHARSVLDHKFGRSGIYRTLCKVLDLIPEKTSIPYPPLDLFWALYRKQ